MKTRLMIVLLCLLWVMPASALEPDRPQAHVLLGASALRDIRSVPEKTLPRSILEQAVAVGIFPGLKKGGYVVGGQYGRGMICHRGSDGRWSPPAFFKIHGGSIGFQVGIQEIDLILVFTSEASFQGLFDKAGVGVGLDLAGTAGPVGREFRVDKTLTDKSPVFSYSKSKGLFAGVSISGTKLSYDYEWTKAFYNEPYSAQMILMENEVQEIPESVQKFWDELSLSSGL